MSSVKLIIRCANQANVDLRVDEAKSDWTVRQLKIYLSDAHTLKPAPERQRIVFAGQLLRDEARLSDNFNRYESSPEPFVLHLVYTVGVDENVAAAQRRANESELRQRKLPAAAATPTTTTSPSTNASSPAPPPPMSNFANTAYYPAQYGGGLPWSTTMMGQQQAQLGGDMTNDWIRQQQQMYATMNAMMSQWYGQYMQAAYGASVGFFPATMGNDHQQQQQNFVFGDQQHPQQQAVAALPVAEQQDAPRGQAQQQQALNAQGGMAPMDMDDEDARNRDWLDYVYMACRAGLLMMILYFYSSIERFIFVMLCCTLMYGLQAGWFGRRGQQQQQDEQQQQRRAPAPVVAPQGPPAQDPPAAGGGDGQREQADGAVQGDQAERPQAQPSVEIRPPLPVEQEMPMTAWNVFWTTCWTFISSFFASLVPERPPPLNI